MSFPQIIAGLCHYTRKRLIVQPNVILSEIQVSPAANPMYREDRWSSPGGNAVRTEVEGP